MSVMKFNKAIVFPVVSEIADAVLRSGKSRDRILRDIANSHPEIAYTPEDWDHIDEVTKEKILSRIRKTLNAIT